ncbi:13472_t:CDS:2, partial [Gigaspora margarita]
NKESLELLKEAIKKADYINKVKIAIDCQIISKSGWGVMVSYQSEKTEDTFIADLV